MFDYIYNSISNLTTMDVVISVLDIVIVWYLIYQILCIIRGTKAMQILLGLLLISVLYFLSTPNLLDLSTLNWTLEKFISSFVIILVIIFQADIRRGLSEFGKSNPLIEGVGEDIALSASPLEEIIKACGLLSERRIGALIAIEMDASLDSYMVEGSLIDGIVTRELLVSIFIPYKANPIHDGAVIIRQNRVYSAGCFLPLSSDDNIEKSLGTRHRAALGLSEATDAIVLVVSEETGIISVAYREQLIRKLNNDELRDVLYKIFKHELKPKTESFGKLLLRRLRLIKPKNREELFELNSDINDVAFSPKLLEGEKKKAEEQKKQGGGHV